MGSATFNHIYIPAIHWGGLWFSPLGSIFPRSCWNVMRSSLRFSHRLASAVMLSATKKSENFRTSSKVRIEIFQLSSRFKALCLCFLHCDCALFVLAFLVFRLTNSILFLFASVPGLLPGIIHKQSVCLYQSCYSFSPDFALSTHRQPSILFCHIKNFFTLSENKLHRNMLSMLLRREIVLSNYTVYFSTSLPLYFPTSLPLYCPTSLLPYTLDLASRSSHKNSSQVHHLQTK